MAEYFKYNDTDEHSIRLSGNVIGTPIFGNANLKFANKYDKIITEFVNPVKRRQYDEPAVLDEKLTNTVNAILSDASTNRIENYYDYDFKVDMYTAVSVALKETLYGLVKKKTISNGYVKYAAFKNFNELSSIDQYNIKSVYIPPKITEIPTGFLSNAINLEEIYFGPDLSSHNLNTIHESAFYNCEKLHNLILPTNIKHIQPYAFHNGESLSIIAINENITDYDKNTTFISTNFDRCFKLDCMPDVFNELLEKPVLKTALFSASSDEHEHDWKTATPLTAHFSNLEIGTQSESAWNETDVADTLSADLASKIDKVIEWLLPSQKTELDRLSEKLHDLLKSKYDDSPEKPGPEPQRSDYQPVEEPKQVVVPPWVPQPPTNKKPTLPTPPSEPPEPGDEPEKPEFEFDGDVVNPPGPPPDQRAFESDWDEWKKKCHDFEIYQKEYAAQQEAYYVKLQGYETLHAAWQSAVLRYQKYENLLEKYENDLEKFEDDFEAYQDAWEDYRDQLEEWEEYEEQVKKYNKDYIDWTAAEINYKKDLSEWKSKNWEYTDYIADLTMLKNIVEKATATNLAEKESFQVTEQFNGVYRIIRTYFSGQEVRSRTELDGVFKDINDGLDPDKEFKKRQEEVIRKKQKHWADHVTGIMAAKTTFEIYDACHGSIKWSFWNVAKAVLAILFVILKTILDTLLLGDFIGTLITALTGTTTATRKITGTFYHRIYSSAWYTKECIKVCEACEPYHSEDVYECQSQSEKELPNGIVGLAKQKFDSEHPLECEEIETGSTIVNFGELVLTGRFFKKVDKWYGFKLVNCKPPTEVEEVMQAVKARAQEDYDYKKRVYQELVTSCPQSKSDYDQYVQWYNAVRSGEYPLFDDCK